MDTNVYTVCYNSLDVFENKEQAKKYFKFCYDCSEGAEHERYASILVDLNFSNLAKDNITNRCNEINIIGKDSEKNICINLDDSLSIEDSIDYYEKKIFPIINVSEDYSINFSGNNPFEEFGSDEDSDYMSSFSKYYEELLIDLPIEYIETKEKSDGKYEMEIHPSIGDKIVIDIRAWDKIIDVLNNIDSVKEQLLNKSKYFYNTLDNSPVTINDVHDWYEKNSNNPTSYESGFSTFEEYFESLCDLDTKLFPITREEYNGLLNGYLEFNLNTHSVFESDENEDLEMEV